jgi:hypothetical protein
MLWWGSRLKFELADSGRVRSAARGLPAAARAALTASTPHSVDLASLGHVDKVLFAIGGLSAECFTVSGLMPQQRPLPQLLKHWCTCQEREQLQDC